MVSGITLLNTSSSKWDRDNELCELLALLSLTSRIYLLIPVLTRILGSHLFLLPFFPLTRTDSPFYSFLYYFIFLDWNFFARWRRTSFLACLCGRKKSSCTQSTTKRKERSQSRNTNYIKYLPHLFQERIRLTHSNRRFLASTAAPATRRVRADRPTADSIAKGTSSLPSLLAFPSSLVCLLYQLKFRVPAPVASERACVCCTGRDPVSFAILKKSNCETIWS